MIDRMSAFLHTKILYRSLSYVSEEFILYVMASMLMIRRYDFFDSLMEKIDDEQECLFSLPVSKNFLGNVWRLGALFTWQESIDKTELKFISKDDFSVIKKRLLTAMENFSADDENWGSSAWGLGLC